MNKKDSYQSINKRIQVNKVDKNDVIIIVVMKVGSLNDFQFTSQPTLTHDSLQIIHFSQIPQNHLPFIVNHLTLIHFVTISHNITLLYRSFWIIICWIDFWQVTKVMENGLTIHSIPLFDSLTCSMLETSLVFQIHHDSMVNQLYNSFSPQCLWLMTTNFLLYYLSISWNTYFKTIRVKTEF